VSCTTLPFESALIVPQIMRKSHNYSTASHELNIQVLFHPWYKIITLQLILAGLIHSRSNLLQRALLSDVSDCCHCAAIALAAAKTSIAPTIDVFIRSRLPVERS
jgi:hypothetical protein